MPHYFFYLKDGTNTLIDEEGVILRDAAAAHSAALAQARDIISHDARKGVIDLTQRINVLDADGELVCSLNFSEAVEVRGA